MLDVSMYSKGCVQAPPSVGASFEIELGILNQINWSIPYKVPAVLTQRDQKGSQSCTAQATCYYTEVLNQIDHATNERYSARHIYSQTFVPGGGALISGAMRIPIVQGAASFASVSDGLSTETIMIDGTDNYLAVMEAKTDKYAAIPNDANIDHLAQTVRDYHGFVTGFYGWNGMFDNDGTIVDWSRKDWGHAIYITGHQMHNGKKCLTYKNSWGPGFGTDGGGFIPEDFIHSGMMFDAHVYADITDLKPASMFKLVQVPGSQEVWIIKGGKKTHLFNEGALLAISEFASIINISQADLDAIPDTGVQLMAVNN